MIECYSQHCKWHHKDEPFCSEPTCGQTFYKVWPDGTVSETTPSHMSDDFMIIPAESEEQALSIFNSLHSSTCGGCGNSDPNKRCLGCMHPF